MKSKMILAWMRGPAGSVVDYWHSEGACNSGDTVRGVSNAHSMCKTDMDYTLRVALFMKRNDGLDDKQWNSDIPDWCVVCLGTSHTCRYCQPYSGLSQREEAAEYLLESWKDAPLFAERKKVARSANQTQ